MKKWSLLSKCLLFSLCFVICEIVFIFLSYSENDFLSKKEIITLYDTPASWISVTNSKLIPQKIDRSLENHFIDPDTNGCFFLTMKMLGNEVDIDKYYSDFFNEVDQEIIHEGKISPFKLYQISTTYLRAQKLDMTVQDLSHQDKNYILKAGRHNYPIVIWYGNDNWEESTPYVLYLVKNDMIYMLNTHETIGLDIETFLKNWKNNFAIIYGKYW